MNIPDTVRGNTARVFVLGWGLASLLLTGTHLSSEDEIDAVLIGYTVPILIACGVLGIGLWLNYRGLSHRHFWRVGLWSGGGILAMLVFQTSRVLYQTIETNTVAEPFFVLLHAGTAGAFVGLLLGIYDVRVKDREAELRSEREWSERLSEALLVVQRVLRHDIRTTVNVISGNVNVMRDADVPEERIDQILGQVSNLEAMASKGRQIESIAERAEYAIQRVALMDVLSEEIETLESEYSDAEISITGPESVDIRALPEIQYVFHEVIENAIVHNERDQPTVEVDVQNRSAPAPAETTDVHIRDNGTGIPEHELEVLEAGEETQLQHSSGIGLWTVKWITEESNGEVRYETTEDGSTVTITLQRAA